MKEMKFLPHAYEQILEKLVSDDIPLYNIPHTCIQEDMISNIKEVIRDTLTGHIVHSDEEFFVTLYYTTVEKVVYARRTYELLKGYDIAQWVMERFPNTYGAFAIRLRPKGALQDTSKQKVWVFNMF